MTINFVDNRSRFLKHFNTGLVYLSTAVDSENIYFILAA